MSSGRLPDPDRCELCRELDADRLCLLEIDPEGETQRRVIQLQDDDAWHEFEIVRTFDCEEGARVHAAKHGIEDATF